MNIVNILSERLKRRFDKACEEGKIAGSERVLSVIAGSFIIGYSGKRILVNPVAFIPTVVLGAGLVMRGLTGRCAVKGAVEPEQEKVFMVIEHRHFKRKKGKGGYQSKVL